MKKMISVFLCAVMLAGVFTACGSKPAQSGSATAESTSAQATEKRAGICVPTYAEYFKVIADAVSGSLQEQGYKVEVMDATGDVQNMVRQIQNFTVSKGDLLYIFPAGDAATFHDVVKEAKDTGIKVVVSHNSTGEDTADSIILCDEFLLGAMGSQMVSSWVDATYPDAKAGEVKILVLENSTIPDMVKRCAGMKIVGQRFLRRVDMTSAGYISKDGGEVFYLDKDGNKTAVEEPTEGLILDENGMAMLNPFYNEKIKIVEFNNRVIQTNMDAQSAMDVVMTANNGENNDIKAVFCYAGEAAVGASEKMLELKSNGVIKEDLSKLAAFGVNATDNNKEQMTLSKDNTSLLRGVMTNGNIVQSIVQAAAALAKGEAGTGVKYEPIGYLVPNASYDGFDEVLYADELPASAEFFKK